MNPYTGQVIETFPGATKPPRVPTPNATLSKSTGVVSYLGADGKVHAIPGADGKPIPYKGSVYYLDQAEGRARP